ncbi:hypothetical protein, partial [Streptomyces tendae]
MSHLRAPAARADRREGGRHGRPAPRTTAALPETHIRPTREASGAMFNTAYELGGPVCAVKT